LTFLDLGADKIYGCTDEFSCNYNPQATIDNESCIYLSAPEIAGNNFAEYLGVEEYTCLEGSSNTTFKWSVTNGQIVSGQGTNKVKIKWGLDPFSLEHCDV